MARRYRYSRRDFLGAMGSTSLLTLGGPVLPRAAAWAAPLSPPARFAYIASDSDREQAIHVFRCEGRATWSLVHSVATDAPSSIAVSQDRQTLFVANRVRRYQNRPSGSVESYGIDQRTGELKMISRRPLALSAVEPEHIAVSPDGRFLVVCATAGGAYNLLPILTGGSLGNVTILRKETGSSVRAGWQDSAHPQQVTFDGHGRLLSSDLGADRLNVFEIREQELVVSHRHASHPGSGPSSIKFHPGLSVLFAGGALDATVTAQAYDEAHGRFRARTAVARAIPASEGAQLHAMTVHPSGTFVVASWSRAGQHGMSSWRFEPDTFSFVPGQTILSPGTIKALQFTREGDRLIAADSSRGTVRAFDFAQVSGELNLKTEVAFCHSPRAMLLT